MNRIFPKHMIHVFNKSLETIVVAKELKKKKKKKYLSLILPI